MIANITPLFKKEGSPLKTTKSSPNSPLVPMSSPDLSDAEREAVAKVLTTPWLSMGPETTAFEEAIQKHTGCQHALAVNSGRFL